MELNTDAMDPTYNNRKFKRLRRKLQKNQTDAEKMIWQSLRKRSLEGFKFLRQYSVGSYILDFYCPKLRLAVEIDGGQHAEKDAKQEDLKRTQFLKSKNIKVLRFWNNEVLKDIESALEHIRKIVLEIDSDSNYP